MERFLRRVSVPEQPATLTCKNTRLLLKPIAPTVASSTPRKAKADEVIANGVTIESAAQFDLQVLANKKLPAGTIFTLISNTSADPISGTFANLADGATLAAGRNQLRASYEGGDGNDLTLTVQ